MPSELPASIVASEWLTIGANARPNAVPPAASNRLSINNCRRSRIRVAPRASRVASSRSRAAPRASSRLARFRHASSRIPPHIANIVTNGLRNRNRTYANPFDPGSAAK